jgi:uncharacterized protein (TIGR03546 family)
MLKSIANLLSAFNSGTKPEELAFAAVVAMFAAFTLTPFNLLVWTLFVFLITANTSMFVLMLVFFKVIALAVDPACDMIGYAVLTAGPLQSLFTGLSTLPVAPFTRFNNTLVMGGFLISLVAAAPVWMGVKSFILYYRKNLAAKIEKARIVKVLNISGLFKFLKGGQ